VNIVVGTTIRTVLDPSFLSYDKLFLLNFLILCIIYIENCNQGLNYCIVTDYWCSGGVILTLPDIMLSLIRFVFLELFLLESIVKVKRLDYSLLGSSGLLS
jgi:hypothetical protein